jgi:hypothetical protein
MQINKNFFAIFRCMNVSSDLVPSAVPSDAILWFVNMAGMHWVTSHLLELWQNHASCHAGMAQASNQLVAVVSL